MRARPALRLILFQSAAIFLAGCSPEWYRDNADAEVYEIVDQKRRPLVSPERREIAFSARQDFLALDAVGGAGELDDFRRTPPPEPEEVVVDIQEILDEAGARASKADEAAGLESPEAPAPPQGGEPPAPEPEAPPPQSADEIDPAAGPDGAAAAAAGSESSEPAAGSESSEEPAAAGGASENRAEGTGGAAAATPAPPDEQDPGAAADSSAPPPSGATDASAEGEPAAPESAPDASAPGAEDAGAPAAEDDRRADTPEPTEEEAAEETARYSSEALADLTARTPKIPARVLSLDDALRLAFANNREYQSQKESVYLSALTLTLARWQFAPRFFGIITGDWNTDSEGSETGQVRSSFGFTKLFASGARLSISVLNNFFQFFTGDRREMASTILDGSLTQPLLRGFGSDIVLEPLTQAERDVVYELRAFERFRRTFAVEVISEYYRVVENVITVRNAYLNWQAQVDNLDRSVSLAEAERLPRLEVDQTRQAELQAHNTWISAVTSYENSLDRFKITLGLGIESSIALDPEELTKLGEESIQELEISVDEAVDLARRYRVDLQTSADEVEDAERRVIVAADSLRAQLDVTGSASLESGDDDAQTPLKFNTADFAYGVGVDLDLPLDRKAERNNYVRQLINLDRVRRDYTLFEDNIALTVRSEYRILEQEIIRYGIQKASLELGEFRVASTTALRDAGRSTTRDVNDALDDLNDARNSLTSALVNYTIAELALYRDLDVLEVNARNQVIEPDLAALIALDKDGAAGETRDSRSGEAGATLVSAGRKDGAR